MVAPRSLPVPLSGGGPGDPADDDPLGFRNPQLVPLTATASLVRHRRVRDHGRCHRGLSIDAGRHLDLPRRRLIRLRHLLRRPPLRDLGRHPTTQLERERQEQRVAEWYAGLNERDKAKVRALGENVARLGKTGISFKDAAAALRRFN